MKNIRLTLGYDGTRYAGWQYQPDVRTLQGTLERAIARVSGEVLRVTASGRTDAGVHATGQVVSFTTMQEMDAWKWTGALNHFLPDDIRVFESVEAPEGFSARHSAIGKVYDYILVNQRPPDPLMKNRAWRLGRVIDVDAMRQAASPLLGEHDFSSFRASGCSAKHPVRELRRLEIKVEGLPRGGRRITFTLEANAFLRHMVRNIVGGLVEVGSGRFDATVMAGILAGRDRTLSGKTAPPQGLYLVEVFY